MRAVSFLFAVATRNRSSRTIVERAAFLNGSGGLRKEFRQDDPSRVVVWELTFSAKIALYGPVHTSGLIKTADINIFDNIEGSL